MTGRLLLRRPGDDIDIEKVLAACAEHGVAVEIMQTLGASTSSALAPNGVEARLPDEHQPRRPSTRELDLTHRGVEMARKGGVPKDGSQPPQQRTSLPRIWRKARPAASQTCSASPRSSGPRTSAAGTEKQADVKNRKVAVR